MFLHRIQRCGEQEHIFLKRRDILKSDPSLKDIAGWSPLDVHVISDIDESFLMHLHPFPPPVLPSWANDALIMLRQWKTGNYVKTDYLE